MKPSYLITGGEGFIGSQITKATNGLSFDKKLGQDILNTDQLARALRDNSISGIFHCAAKISVPESIKIPKEYQHINVDGTRSVMTATSVVKILSENNNGVKIVFSSSAAVYGEANYALTETSPCNPKSPYAQNKKDAEELLAQTKNGTPHIALRYFNVYGPGQSREYAGVITAFIINALSGKDLVINGDGNQVRDFIFIDDIVSANIAAMNYQNETFEIFNIASGTKTTINELAATIIKLTGSSSKIVHASAQSGDIIYSQADTSKAKKLLGWQAKTPLQEGLQKTIDAFLATEPKIDTFTI